MEGNNDLIWDLDRFEKRQRAQDYVMGFENKICVFSGTVAQLYTTYNIFFPKEENRKLVILPDPYAPHDTFQGLTEDAVRPTGLLLIPAEAGDPTGRLNMIIPMKNGDVKYRKVPLNVGLNLINRKRGPSKPFLPVLVKGDLRELNANTPCLHLHSLNLDRIDHLSGMVRGDIQAVILEKLSQLASRH